MFYFFYKIWSTRVTSSDAILPKSLLTWLIIKRPRLLPQHPLLCHRRLLIQTPLLGEIQPSKSFLITTQRHSSTPACIPADFINYSCFPIDIFLFGVFLTLSIQVLLGVGQGTWNTWVLVVIFIHQLFPYIILRMVARNF